MISPTSDLANVLGRFAKAKSRFANVLLVHRASSQPSTPETTRKPLLNYSGRARVWMDQRALTDHERTELAWSKLRIRFCK